MEVMVQTVPVVNCNVRRAYVEDQISRASPGAWQPSAYGFENVEENASDAWKPFDVVSNLAQEQNVQLMRIPKRSDLGT